MKKTFLIFAIVAIVVALILVFIFSERTGTESIDTVAVEETAPLTQQEYEQAVSNLRMRQAQTYELYVIAFLESYPEVYEDDIWQLILMAIALDRKVGYEIDNLEKPE